MEFTELQTKHEEIKEKLHNLGGFFDPVKKQKEFEDLERQISGRISGTIRKVPRTHRSAAKPHRESA